MGRITQDQMILPLLESLDERGGRADVQTLYESVAERVAVDTATRQKRIAVGKAGQVVNAFERDVRWAQQRAKLMGLIEPVEARHWRLTGKGRESLHEAAPGVVITVFETPEGVALFGRCEDAIGYIEDGSVQLLLTSPPFPLLRPKAYGNHEAEEYVDWFLNIAKDWPRKITGDGSIVINLADVWERGRPTLSLYQEKLLIQLTEQLGLRLCQRFSWLNPAKLPAPAEWVTVRRVRVKPSLEQIYWLSPHDHPYADNRAVLREYSEAMRARIRRGGEREALRPSGHAFKAGAFGQAHAGSIPDTLICAANTESNSPYQRFCREQGLPVHPARFPAALPEFFIKLMTRAGDTVFDPFGGSLTTAAVAQRLGRRWLSSEMNLEYLRGGRARFAPLAP